MIPPLQTRMPPRWALLASLVGWAALFVAGCGAGRDNAALDPDANGFICLECKAKFYTARKIFANHCPSCQKMNIEYVVGFLCPVDGTVTYAPRGRGSLACQKCGKVTSGLLLPSEAELKAWGATRQDGPAVGVH